MRLWGIIVTRTCHLVRPGVMDPVCQNGAVMATMAGLRRRYASGDPDERRDAPPIYGYADARPACRVCIRGLDQLASRYVSIAPTRLGHSAMVANEARAHNARHELMEANDGNT